MEFGEAVFVDRNNGWQIWNETLRSLSMAKMVKVLKGKDIRSVVPGVQSSKERGLGSLNGLQKQLSFISGDEKYWLVAGEEPRPISR